MTEQATQQDLVRFIKINIDGDAVTLNARVESCFVDDAGKVIAVKPNSDVRVDVALEANDPHVAAPVEAVKAKRQAEIEAAKQAAEAAAAKAEPPASA